MKAQIPFLGISRMVALAFALGCSDASLTNGATGSGTDKKSDASSTSEASGGTDEEPAAPPVPVSGVNLTYACWYGDGSSTSAAIDCTARSPADPMQKIAGVKWTHETSAALGPGQTVSVTETPDQPLVDARYMVTVAESTELLPTLKLIVPIAEFAGIKNVIVVGALAPVRPGATATLPATSTARPDRSDDDDDDDDDDDVGISLCTPDSSDQWKCTQQRIRYAAATANAPETCVFETQTARCRNGVCGTFSGTYTAPECLEGRVRYESIKVSAPAQCVAETQQAACADGKCATFSGTFAEAQCTIERSMYASQMGPSCQSEIQQSICTGGLCGGYSGTYAASSCSTCAGVALGGYCWYGGEPSQACTTVCSTHGGTTNGSIDYVGWPGGTLANCNAVLAALGMGTSDATDYTFGSAFGCVLDGGSTRYRYIGTSTELDGASMTTQQSARACSCVN